MFLSAPSALSPEVIARQEPFLGLLPSIEPVNTNPTGHQNQAIERRVPWMAVTKASVPNMYTSSLHRDIDDLAWNKEGED